MDQVYRADAQMVGLPGIAQNIQIELIDNTKSPATIRNAAVKDATDRNEVDKVVRLLKLLSESKVYTRVAQTGSYQVTTTWHDAANGDKKFVTFFSAAKVEGAPPLQNFLRLMQIFGMRQSPTDAPSANS